MATTTVTVPVTAISITTHAPSVSVPGVMDTRRAVVTRPADRKPQHWNPAQRTPQDDPISRLSGEAGDLMYHDGVQWVRIPAGNEGQVLTVSGGRPVWGRNHRDWSLKLARIDTGAGVTALEFMLNGLSSKFVGVPAPFDLTFNSVSVTAYHLDASSPPATGTLRLRKNGGFGADVATFTFNFSASSGVEVVTSGEFAGAPSFAKDDRIHVIADFAAVDIPAAYVVLTALRD